MRGNINDAHYHNLVKKINSEDQPELVNQHKLANRLVTSGVDSSSIDFLLNQHFLSRNLSQYLTYDVPSITDLINKERRISARKYAEIKELYANQSKYNSAEFNDLADAVYYAEIEVDDVKLVLANKANATIYANITPQKVNSRNLLASATESGDELITTDPAGTDIILNTGSDICTAVATKMTDSNNDIKYAYLTAAHCLDDVSSVTLNLPNGRTRVINTATQAFINPNYNPNTGIAFDIALLAPSQYNSYDASIAIEMAVTSPNLGDNMNIYGIGNYRASTANTCSVTNLEQLCSSLTDQRQRGGGTNLESYNQDNGQGSFSWYCDGSRDEVTSCPGDSGGGVLSDNNGPVWGVLSGVIYTSRSCGIFSDDDCIEYQQDTVFAPIDSDIVDFFNANAVFAPTDAPTLAPSFVPSHNPSSIPTSRPSNQPSSEPTMYPSMMSTILETANPTFQLTNISNNSTRGGSGGGGGTELSKEATAGVAAIGSFFIIATLCFIFRKKIINSSCVTSFRDAASNCLSECREAGTDSLYYWNSVPAYRNANNNNSI